MCAGLREVLEATTRHQLAEHLPEILPPIQAALCDSDATVREAAGAAFGVLFRGGALRHPTSCRMFAATWRRARYCALP